MSTTWVLIPWSLMKHRSMKYSELLEELQSLSPQQLQQTVTLYSIKNDEFMAAFQGDFTDEDEQVLCPDHYVITF